MVIFLDLICDVRVAFGPGGKRLLGGPALVLIRGSANNGAVSRKI